jgi:serine/threonine-protein kinase RsbW
MNEMNSIYLEFKDQIDKYFLPSLQIDDEELKLNLQKDLSIEYFSEDSSIRFSISTKYFPKPIQLSFTQCILKSLLRYIFENKTLIDDLIIALDEIVANILEHSYKRNGNEQIEFTFVLTKNIITIFIKDYGSYGHLMDISIINSHQTQETFLKNFMKTKRGMGLYIVKKIMDQIKYESRPNNFNLLTLTKKIESSSLIRT